jgi:MoxR-like ATPase
MQNNNKDAAAKYAAKGWKVYPIWPAQNGGCGCGKSKCHSPAKHPHDAAIRSTGSDEKGTKAASDDQEKIGKWWEKYPDANVGIRTGAVSDLLVLDIDSDDAQRDIDSWNIPPTPTVVTGRGRHLYFRYPTPLGLERITSHTNLLLGADIRADGSGVVAPPSTHASGRTYNWASGLSPDDVSVAECPQQLLILILTKADAAKKTETINSKNDKPKEPATVDIQGKLLKVITSDHDFSKVWSGNAGLPSLSEHRLSTAKRLIQHSWTDADVLAGLREFDTQHWREPEPDATYLREIAKARAAAENTNNASKSKRRPVTLIHLLEKNEVIYVKDELENPFLQIPTSSGQMVTLPLWSNELMINLSGRYYKEIGDTLSKTQLTEALSAIEYRCMEGNIIHPIIRMGRLEDAIYIDHKCKGDRCLVLRGGKVTEGYLPTGHYFQRSSHMQPYGPIDFTNSGQGLSELTRLMNIADHGDFRQLMSVWITSIFIPSIPQPILILIGPQGTGKSTTFKIIREITDPSSVRHLAPPKDTRDLVVQMNENYVVLYDNVSRIGNMSDDYCRAITGEHMMVRDLYTTAGSRTFSYQRVIGFNGIDVPVGQSDLLDRVLIVEAEYIPEEKRLLESCVWSHFEALKPLVIGEMLTTVSRAIDMPLRTKNLPRMADWAAWGANIAEITGIDPDSFLAAYSNRIAEAREVGLNSNLFVHLVKELVLKNAHPEWKVRATDLLTMVTEIAQNNQLDYRRDDSWPHQPAWVTRRLKLASEDLRHAGITFKDRVSDGPNHKALLFQVKL